ncbi:streptomycin 6-kinase [Spinactinospora alkalitolerans]|uniref:Streptomycin 6-kinase n=1 Tax=Spinactinospora alkalitolerans TaxID=687207 RepID=A0A852TP33_9ACTN|nr:aminoglycoside phosphotransferase family protein [Spinactinospora alkalitolerans]NYE45191.1 streptomycin 6-kinase [Spinactinospora alkalitolerans]
MTGTPAPRSAPAPLPAPVVRNVRALTDGTAWIDALPGILERLCAEWELDPGRPFDGGSCSWAAPVTTADGGRAVLKVSYPHREARGEGAALRFWDGAGAVRLLRSSPDGFALLLEACEPGGRLKDAEGPPEDLLTAAAHALAGLWSRGSGEGLGLERVGDVVAEWAVLTRERFARLRPDPRVFDPRLVELGAGLLESLPATATRTVAVHGDFNPGNILAATRTPWLAIDPKPMVGDPGYDPWPLLMQVDPPGGHADPKAVFRHRFALVADVLGEPVERLLAWAFARAVESSFDLLDTGFTEEAEQEMTEARVLADTAGL